MKKIYTFYVDDFTTTPPKNGAERCVLKFITETDAEGAQKIKTALRLAYPLPNYALVTIESNCGKVLTSDALPMGKEFSNRGNTFVENERFFIVHKVDQSGYSDVKLSLNRKAAFNLQMALGAYLAALPPEK